MLQQQLEPEVTVLQFSHKYIEAASLATNASFDLAVAEVVARMETALASITIPDSP